MIFAGPWLARRLETAEALNDAACAISAGHRIAKMEHLLGWTERCTR
jgi:hypothetical protein